MEGGGIVGRGGAQGEEVLPEEYLVFDSWVTQERAMDSESSKE